MRGTFFGCCAWATTATVSSNVATKIDGTAAFFIAHLVSSVMYHADRDKGKCDLHGGTRELTVEWEDQIRPLGYLYGSGFIRTIARLPPKTRKQEPDNKDRNYQPKHQLHNALAVNQQTQHEQYVKYSGD